MLNGYGYWKLKLKMPNLSIASWKRISSRPKMERMGLFLGWYQEKDWTHPKKNSTTFESSPQVTNSYQNQRQFDWRDDIPSTYKVNRFSLLLVD
jgi:hypothetical protein